MVKLTVIVYNRDSQNEVFRQANLSSENTSKSDSMLAEAEKAGEAYYNAIKSKTGIPGGC